jgi:hypothetical protein
MEAGFRFYALYDKMYREDILAHAYAQCRSNKGAPGVDGQDFADIEAYGLERWLGELAIALKEETYRPDPIRRVFIPKPNGKLRLGRTLPAVWNIISIFRTARMSAGGPLSFVGAAKAGSHSSSPIRMNGRRFTVVPPSVGREQLYSPRRSEINWRSGRLSSHQNGRKVHGQFVEFRARCSSSYSEGP